MFLENTGRDQKRGWIEVICGSMFSGKTEELIRRLKRSELAQQRVEIYKPDTDTRYDPVKIISHNGTAIVSRPVSNSNDILDLTRFANVIGIDEGQFFDKDLPAVCRQLAESGTRVIVAGLDMDYKGQPFGPMPHLMAIAEYVTKVHAICMECGNLAYVSHRKTNTDHLVLLGETEHYEPLCRTCFTLKTTGR